LLEAFLSQQISITTAQYVRKYLITFQRALLFCL